MAKGYSKIRMPLGKVKEKEFLSRSMKCKGVGFSFVRDKPGEGATYVHRHKVRKKCLLHLRERVADFRRQAISMRKGPASGSRRVYRALGTIRRRTWLHDLGAVPPKTFPRGRTPRRRIRTEKRCRVGRRRRQCEEPPTRSVAFRRHVRLRILVMKQFASRITSAPVGDFKARALRFQIGDRCSKTALRKFAAVADRADGSSPVFKSANHPRCGGGHDCDDRAEHALLHVLRG